MGVSRRVARWLWFTLHPGSYQDAWRGWMRWRLRFEGPREAVGGRWDDLGRRQFEFLQGEGLEPRDRVLDVGCGTLRAGRFLLDYLEPEGYVGMDVSGDVLEAAEGLHGPLLEENRGELVQNHSLDLRGWEVAIGGFDWVWAHSVLTHVPLEEAGLFVRSVGVLLHPGGSAFASYFPVGARDTPKDFGHGFEALAGFAPEGVVVERVEYEHPRGQELLRVRRERPGEKDWGRSR